MLTLALVTTCTLTGSSTAVSPALQQCQVLTSDSQRPLCPGQCPGQGQGVRLGVGVPGTAPASRGWFTRDGEASGLHSPSQCHQRSGRGGTGQMVTLPSLLTSSSPCNLLDSLLIKAQCCLTINRSEGSAFQHRLTGSCRNCPRLVEARAALEKVNQ